MSNQPIQCKAAVAWNLKEPLKIETITVDPPKEGEVRIKILYTSVCHTDEYTLSGADSETNLPCILGHEGVGEVESIGIGVSSVAVGDLVIPLYIPQCRDCVFCKNNKTNLCRVIRGTQGKGLLPDGSSRFSIKGQRIFHFMGTSTFSQYTVLPEISVAKINKLAKPDEICLLGCGLPTGYGAAVNVAKVQPGDTTVVFGLGAVGLAACIGCQKMGASRVIGVDINEEKFEMARQFGITEFINPKKLDKPLKDVLLEMTSNIGFDHTFECVGNVDLMKTAFESSAIGWGQSIVIGVAGAGQEIRTRPFNLVVGRKWMGCAFGGWKSRDSVPMLVDKHVRGELFDVDKFITHRREGIECLNEAFELLRTGKSLRCVIKY